MFLWYCMDFSGGSYLKSLFVSRITSLEKSVHLFNALVLINVVCFDRFLGFSEWVSFVCWENLHLCRWRRSPAVIYSEIVHILCFGMRSNLIWNFAHLNALGGKNTLIFAWSSCRGPHQQDRPYLLMICVWTCTKIQPEIDGFLSLQRVRIPSFTLGLSHDDHDLCWDLILHIPGITFETSEGVYPFVFPQSLK